MLNRYLLAFSFGDDSGTNPTSSVRAVWNGLMVGATSNPANIMQGHAKIDIDDFSAGNVNVDVEFTRCCYTSPDGPAQSSRDKFAGEGMYSYGCASVLA